MFSRPASRLPPAPFRRAFTLVELLVVISIIGILVGILLPAVQSAREAGRRSVCANNLRQLGVALQGYHTEYGQFPYNYNNYTSGIGRGSMLVRLLPYIEQTTIYKLLDFTSDQLWESSVLPGTNPPVHVYSVVIPTFVCPSEVYRTGVDASWDNNFGGRTGSSTGTIAMTSYACSMGNQYMPNDIETGCVSAPENNLFNTIPNDDSARHGNTTNPNLVSGPFSRESWAASLAQITDGASNTIAMGEVRQYCGAYLRMGWMHEDGVWVATTGPINSATCPGEQGIPIDNGISLNNCQSLFAWNVAHTFKSPHKGGATFVFCDGSVHFLNEAISYVTYQELGDRRDGQAISANTY